MVLLEEASLTRECLRAFVEARVEATTVSGLARFCKKASKVSVESLYDIILARIFLMMGCTFVPYSLFKRPVYLKKQKKKQNNKKCLA